MWRGDSLHDMKTDKYPLNWYFAAARLALLVAALVIVGLVVLVAILLSRMSPSERTTPAPVANYTTR